MIELNIADEIPFKNIRVEHHDHILFRHLQPRSVHTTTHIKNEAHRLFATGRRGPVIST